MSLRWCIVIFIVRTCSAVIYHLDYREYQRMPPLFSLDEYESCLAEEGSAYCLVQLHVYAEAGNPLVHTIKEYSDHTFKHYNHSIIDRGICVRKSCEKYMSSVDTTEALTRSLETCVSASLRKEYALSARVSALYYCDLHHEPRDVDAWDWAVLLLILGLLALNLVGSLYEFAVSKQSKNTEKSGNAFLLSFSVIRNWKWLTDTECSDPLSQRLQFIHGSRVIANFCTVLAHAIFMFASGFISNSHDFEESYELPGYLLIYNGVMIVQIFFLISGFLMVFKLRCKEETRTFTAWDIPKIIALRLSRLVPVLAITLALSTTWVRHMGSGPLWKFFVTRSLVSGCRTYWWHTLLFFNNYMSDNKYCLVQTWHLAADMQVFLVGITAYILTRGWARRVLLSGLVLISAVAPALHTLLQDLDAVYISPEFYRSFMGSTFRFQHILGHNNLPCFIMGMITASWLYDWQKKGRHLEKNKGYKWMQYLSIAAMPLVLYSGRVFYADGPRASPWMRAAYSAAIRLLFGLVGVVMFPAFYANTPSYLKSVFEWRHWVVPSRLSYSVFLLHMVVIHVMLGSRLQLSYFSGFNLMTTHICTVVVSYLISIPFYLMVEAPFTALFINVANISSRSPQSRGLLKNVAKKE